MILLQLAISTDIALTWTLFFPEHQEKCREEIKDVLHILMVCYTC